MAARLLLVVALALPGPAFAGAGRAGAALLQQPFGSRPFALGQAYCALGDEAFGLFYNPAGLTRLQRSELATQFIQGLVDNRLGSAIFATPLNENNALGVGVSYFDGGKADIFDANGLKTATVNFERDMLVDLGYSRAFEFGPGRLHAGAAGKLLRSSVANDMQATAMGGDAGALLEARTAGGIGALALAFQNVGSGIRYSGGLASGAESDPLPTTARVGLSYSRPAFKADDVTFAIEADRVFLDNQLFAGIGIEYLYHKLCSLRLGYRAGQDNGALTAGAGLTFKNASIDYGFGLAQTFNSTHQISLNYRFAIPGIRYSSGLSVADEIMDKTREDLTLGRYFDAADKIKRLEGLLPESAAVAQLRQRLNFNVSTLVTNPALRRYEYAQGYLAYNDGKWAQAVESLQASVRNEPNNTEAIRYLKKAQAQLEEQGKRQYLQQQAKIARLFELANQAFEAGDRVRARRIADEILRVSPYQPAQSLKQRLDEPVRRASAAASQPSPKPKAPQTGALAVSDEDIARSEELYNEAVRAYAEAARESDPDVAARKLKRALRNLQDGLKLNPGSDYLKNTLQLVQRELAQYRQ